MSYDVFLSHNRADKEWVRNLHDSLARHDYNGRNLRTWIDEEVLDPGLLSSDRELNSALDRSRYLIVILSPEAIASQWVQDEISYFLGVRDAEDAVAAQDYLGVEREYYRPVPRGFEAELAERLATIRAKLRESRDPLQ